MTKPNDVQATQAASPKQAEPDELPQAIPVPKGYKLIHGHAYGQDYVSLVAPDGKAIVNAYEQGAPQMFAFLKALATPQQAVSAQELSDEQIAEVAEDVAVHVMHHIREMYPAALTAIPKTGTTSIRNCIKSQVGRFIREARAEAAAARAQQAPQALEKA